MAFSSRRRNYMLVRHRKDGLIEFFRKMLNHSFVLNLVEETAPQTWKHFEELVEEHIKDPVNSRLKHLVSTVGTFFTPLPLCEAYLEYDAHYHISRRKYVSISFDDVRHILNLAQVKASCKQIGLLSFDGDQTLYSDGKNFNDEDLAMYIIAFLQNGTYITLTTAAGYGLDAAKYEVRVQYLLDAFKKASLPEDVVSKFYVLGGECNYLLQCNKNYKLSPVTDWSPKETGTIDQTIVKRLIDTAEKSLRTTINELCLNARILRKERAVGLIHGGILENSESGMQGSLSLRREVLDESCLRVMEDLRKQNFKIPYCAFNGGSDVWVDVGNKRVGVSTLQDLLNVPAEACIHVGDQMYETGNDIAARSCCPTIWISNPTETKYILKAMLSYIGLRESPIPKTTKGFNNE